MTVALTYLAWTLVLALAQIFAAAVAKRLQEPPMWGAGSRDSGQPHYTGAAARLTRAQSNLFETMPVFLGAVLVCHLAGREGGLSDWGAAIYFWGRVLYVPAYLVTIPFLRTGIYVVSTAGLILVLCACLIPH